MKQFSDEQIEYAIKNAPIEILNFNRRVHTGKALLDYLKNRKISDEDRIVFQNEICYVTLGLRPIQEFAEAVMAGTTGDEENIFSTLNEMVPVIFEPVGNIIEAMQHKRFEETLKNAAPAAGGISKNEVSVNRQVDSVSSSIGSANPSIPNGIDVPIDTLSKDDLLSGIENPVATVAKPNIVLPNKKPSTSDVLSGIATMPVSANTMDPTLGALGATSNPNTSKSQTPSISPQEIQDLLASMDHGADLSGIVDPLKMMPGANQSMPAFTPNINSAAQVTSAATVASIPTMDAIVDPMKMMPPLPPLSSSPLQSPLQQTPPTPITPSPEAAIRQAMENKLGAVQGTPAKESFGLVPKHDPYREPTE